MKRNIWRYILYGVIVLILLAVQSSNVLAVFDINPDFILVIAVLNSYYYGEYYGVLLGFTTGIIEDAMSGSLFGLNAFVLTLISGLLTVYRRFILMSDVLSFLIYVILATVVKYILFVLFTLIFQRNMIMNWMILLKLTGEIVYNSIAGGLLFYIAPLLYKRNEI